MVKGQGHGVIIDALKVLRAQLMRDLFAIAKFLFVFLIDLRLEQKLSYRKQIAIA